MNTIKLNFLIKGNHADLMGNPLPKLKMTGKQSWMPKAQQYKRWKLHVRDAVIKELNKYPELQSEVNLNLLNFQKPLTTSKKQKGRMEIMIRWKNDVHGDPENIFGSIADSIFANDKYLSGSFDFEYSQPGRGGEVDVKIEL